MAVAGNSSWNILIWLRALGKFTRLVPKANPQSGTQASVPNRAWDHIPGNEAVPGEQDSVQAELTLYRDPLLRRGSSAETDVARSNYIESNDRICYEPNRQSLDGETHDYLIFFITGNPGLIRYYQPFLSRLHCLLDTDSNPTSRSFQICGYRFRGMEYANDESRDQTQEKFAVESPTSPVSLGEQIDYQENKLYEEVDLYREQHGKSPKVILMGHSVGSYMLLEIIKRHRDRIHSGARDFDLIGGILLFPTITDIAQSPLGVVASKILEIPRLPTIMGFLAKALSRTLPASLFYELVKRVTGFSEHAARTTANFIKSPMGVQQVLHLARDEMHCITEDKWDEEVWGAATAEGTDHRDTANWNLTLYWGQKDKWVANTTRDRLIRARGHRSPIQTGSGTQDRKPVMEIDNEGIPHDFCTTIRNSETIANKAKSWVDGIIESHRTAIS
ncbi:hypothetical protein ACLMJK_008447 [Lecanora helva]